MSLSPCFLMAKGEITVFRPRGCDMIRVESLVLVKSIRNKIGRFVFLEQTLGLGEFPWQKWGLQGRILEKSLFLLG